MRFMSRHLGSMLSGKDSSSPLCKKGGLKKKNIFGVHRAQEIECDRGIFRVSNCA